MNARTPSPRGTLLVADDQPDGIHALAHILRDDYDVFVATSGPMALEIAFRSPRPDLVLLDVEMPGMSGHEVCLRLRQSPSTADMPIIFVTGRDAAEDEAVGLGLGAVDYIHKPFHPATVRARIETHLRLHRQQTQIEAQKRHIQTQFENLRELESLRDQLVHMIVHDLRSPLAGILGYAELLGMELGDAGRADLQSQVGEIMAAAASLQHMIDNLLDVSRMEARQMPMNLIEADLRDVVGAAMATLGSLVAQAGVNTSMPAEPVPVLCDPDLVRRMVENLVANAIKFSGREGNVRVAVEALGTEAKVTVRDDGPGIPAEFHRRIFDKFGQASPGSKIPKHSTGLGLTFCKLAAEAQGGAIGLESAPGHGSSFWFTLPSPVRKAP